jgi:protein-S-isoprenylcysteine O-methyltransferase Ste14
MRASEFEFRHRIWIILGIYALAFAGSYFERVRVGEWALRGLEHWSWFAGAMRPRTAAQAVFGLGAALVGAAALLRTWGAAYLHSEVVHAGRLHSDRLVADGPYRYLRNPLYFGGVLTAAGIGLMAGPLSCLVLVAGMTFFLLRLIGREEAFLLEKQGEAYRAYQQRVPRLWPALMPRLPAGRIQPRWGQAWAGEFWMWVFFAGYAGFAATLRPLVIEATLLGFLAVGLPIRLLQRRRTERPAS